MNPTHEELRTWCHGEMRAASDTAIHRRAVAILKLLDVATMPPWLADAAEALGEVRPEDGAPLALNWTQVIAAIHELRDERDHWKKRAESAEYALGPYLCPKCQKCLTPQELGHTMCRKCAEKDMAKEIKAMRDDMYEARSHLGAIMIQTQPQDDPIIIGHVADALRILGGTAP